MSKQLSYYVASQDFFDLMAFAEQQGCLAIPQVVGSEFDRPEYSPTEFESTLGPDTTFFYLRPSEFSAVEAFYAEMEFDQGRYKLLGNTSPVIEVSREVANEDLIAKGRIYLSQDQSDSRYVTTSKLFDRLKRFIKKNWTRTQDGKFYFGSEAAHMCQAGKAKVKYGGIEIKLPTD